MKMAAMTDVIAKDKKVQKVYLINQDYSFGKAVAAARRRCWRRSGPTSRWSATSCIRCRR
jgi:branched-chain amino acid transport system substrate-binding protein